LLEDHVARASTDPNECVVLRRRCASAVEADDLAEGAEASWNLVGCQATPEIGAEGEDEVDAPGGHSRLLELRDLAPGISVIYAGPDIELDELVRDGALREDAELR